MLWKTGKSTRHPRRPREPRAANVDGSRAVPGPSLQLSACSSGPLSATHPTILTLGKDNDRAFPTPLRGMLKGTRWGGRQPPLLAGQIPTEAVQAS